VIPRSAGTYKTSQHEGVLLAWTYRVLLGEFDKVYHL
jgi:hypothetical protein